MRKGIINFSTHWEAAAYADTVEGQFKCRVKGEGWIFHKGMSYKSKYDHIASQRPLQPPSSVIKPPELRNVRGLN